MVCSHIIDFKKSKDKYHVLGHQSKQMGQWVNLGQWVIWVSVIDSVATLTVKLCTDLALCLPWKLIISCVNIFISGITIGGFVTD